jgi:hypothetical protein
VPRVHATTYRLGEQTERQIAALAEALTADLGTPQTATSVIRIAVRDLHRKKVRKNAAPLTPPARSSSEL